MDLIKHKINFKKIDDEFIYLNFFVLQKMDNMGSFSNEPFISNPINRELSFKDRFTRLDNTSLNSWFTISHEILSGYTSSRIDELKSYDIYNPYIVNFDIESINYINYNFQLINGVSRVTKYDSDEKIYVFDGKNDSNIGQDSQTTGIRYIDKDFNTYFYFINEGLNQTNAILEANYKEEYLNGVVDRLETKNDIFINRGAISVNEKILKMAEINNLNQLENYGNGFFNLVE